MDIENFLSKFSSIAHVKMSLWNYCIIFGIVSSILIFDTTLSRVAKRGNKDSKDLASSELGRVAQTREKELNKDEKEEGVVAAFQES